MRVRYSGVFHYKSSPASPKVPVGICDVDIVEYDNGVCGVMITERKDNQGVLVTTACDRIATELYGDLLPDKEEESVVWLEHAPAYRADRAHIDVVQFESAPLPGAGHPGEGKKRPRVFSNPLWLRFFEAKRIVPLEFLETYRNILKELVTARLVFTVEDKDGCYWRVWASQDGLFIVSANPAAKLPDRRLDVPAVTQVLKDHQQLLRSDKAIEEQFTTALMKGFLNRGL